MNFRRRKRKRGETPGSGRCRSRREREDREGLTRKGNRNSSRKISWKVGEAGSIRKENYEGARRRTSKSRRGRSSKRGSSTIAD
jgi:hypothetical protein